MLQYCFLVYLIFILSIITQLKYGISKENVSTKIVDASGILIGISQDNGTTKVVEESKIVFGVSKENKSKAVIDTSKILRGISEENGLKKIVDASDIPPHVLEERRSAEVANASDILPGILQENGTIAVLNASNILSGISQENRTTEKVVASGILQENGTIEVLNASDILAGISQEKRTVEVLNASNILSGISQENRITENASASGILQENETIELLNASNILSGISQDNRTTEKAGASGILQENEAIKVFNSSNILSGISQENRTIDVFNASNVLSGVSKENRTTEKESAYDILQENRTIDVVGKSKIFLDVSKENESKTFRAASNILRGVSNVNEAAKEVDVSTILLGVVQGNGNIEVVNKSDILSDISQENETTEIVYAYDTLPGILQKNRTTEIVEESKILHGISKENESAVIDTSNILPGISDVNEFTKGVGASNILLDVLQENGAAEVADASHIMSGISQKNETTEILDATGILEENGTIVAVRESKFLLVVSKENESKSAIDTSTILPGISQVNESTETEDASDILPGISEEYDTTEKVDISNNFPGISRGNGDRGIIEMPNISPKRKCESKQLTCDDLAKFGDVVCDKIVDLMDDGTGDIEYYHGQVYVLSFTDTKRLPARPFSEICIKHLIFDDPDVIVDENLFDGVELLKEFIVQQSSIEVVPDFRFVRDSIEIISIQSSRLMSLEGKHLQNLTLVTELSFFNNSISSINKDVFKGTENIRKLDLSRNLLTSIPPKLLDPMKKLSTFNASCNNLLHVNNLFSITHPQAIYLFSNNITEGHAVLPVLMKEVETLVLSDNPIKELKTPRFFLNIPNVKDLLLSHCGLREFNDEFMVILEYLVTLDLSYNLLGEDSDAFYDRDSGSFSVDKHVYFETTFNLIGNSLRSPNKLLRYKQFQRLKLARNRIQYLTDEDFKFTFDSSKYDMKYMELQENQIQRIDTDTFRALRKHLQKLDLSSNSISSLNGTVRYLSKLKQLDLTNNLIQSFARDEFAGLDELSHLYLEHNQMKDIWQFQQLPSLRILKIAYNDIKLIRMDQVPDQRIYMELAENPFECDCRLQPFILRLITRESLAADVDLCLQSDVGSSLPETFNCPGMCLCGCTDNGNEHFMSIDCTSKSLTVAPQFLRKREDNETITPKLQSPFVMRQNIYPSIHIEDRVLRLNLENNSLESLEEDQLLPNLTQLFLANNKLRWLPDSLFDNQVNLKNVSLSGNPWNCDCNALKFKKWLTFKHNIIQDIDDVRCGTSDKGKSILNGRVIWKLTDLELCPTDVGLIIPVSFGVLTFMTFCLATTILYTKYNLNIKVFLYSHGFTFVKEEDIDYDKEFDAFLAFSHEDGEFVTEEIISVIEDKDPSINMCIHYRHFTAGEFIYNNIVRAVRNSKRTVVVLSENFIQSEWCLVEFKTAHMQALEDKVHRVIVIKVGDLPKVIDPTIKVHLDSTTYLTWGERNFWNKLLYVLPTGSGVENMPQEV